MKSPQFYLANRHQIKLDHQTQSKYWAVQGEKLMFTYFEVEPNTSFAEHSHESEQMTYVLEGELFFKIDDEVFCVGPGNLISIPSFKVHSVWTEKLSAKAVDAWSPVNSNY